MHDPLFPATLGAIALVGGLVVLIISVLWLVLKGLPKTLAAESSSAAPPILEKDCIHDKETYSPALRALLGAEEDEELTLKTLGNYLVEKDAKIFKQALYALSGDADTIELDLRLKEHNQTIKCIATRYIDEKGVLHTIRLHFFTVDQHLTNDAEHNPEINRLSKEFKSLIEIINHAPCPVWRRDENLNITYHNLAYLRIVKEHNDDLSQEGALELTKDNIECAKAALSTGQMQNIQRHLIIKGQRCLYDMTEIPLRNEKGTMGYGYDVTQQEVAEKELSVHITSQSDLLESLGSATAIFGSDAKLKFFNSAFVKLWGLEEAWLGKKPTYGEVLETLRDKRMLPEQADFKNFKENQLALFTNLLEPQEDFFYLPNGGVLRVIIVPYALGGLIFTYEDMTEHVTLERQYNELIAVKRATIDNLSEGIAVFGEDGKLHLYNPVYASMWQLDTHMLDQQPHISEILEKTKFLLDYSNDWKKFKEDIIASAANREIYLNRMERMDGSVIDWTSVPLPDGATLMTYTDVTDSALVEYSLRAEKEALKEADTLKSNFLANVSYELRSPLTSIRGFSEVLTKQYFGDLSDKQKEYIQAIHDSSIQLSTLINDILDIATVDAGYMTLEVKEFDIHKAFEAIMPLLKNRAKEYGMKLTTKCPKTIGSMLGDEKRVRQITTNLINNAIRQCGKGGEISLTVSSTKDKKEILISVKDNGPGIDPKDQPYIFEQFYKMYSEKNNGGSSVSNALGLPVVKSFIELHGGYIEVDSGPRKGTKITCHLPRENASLLKQQKRQTADMEE